MKNKQFNVQYHFDITFLGVKKTKMFSQRARVRVTKDKAVLSNQLWVLVGFKVLLCMPFSLCKTFSRQWKMGSTTRAATKEHWTLESFLNAIVTIPAQATEFYIWSWSWSYNARYLRSMFVLKPEKQETLSGTIDYSRTLFRLKICQGCFFSHVVLVGWEASTFYYFVRLKKVKWFWFVYIV